MTRSRRDRIRTIRGFGISRDSGSARRRISRICRPRSIPHCTSRLSGTARRRRFVNSGSRPGERVAASGASARAVTTSTAPANSATHGLDPASWIVAGAPVEPRDVAQEGAFAALLSTRWTCAPAPLGERDGEHQPGKAGAGAEVEPASAPPARSQELQRVGDVARPDLVRASPAPTRFLIALPARRAPSTRMSSVRAVSRETVAATRQAPSARRGARGVSRDTSLGAQPDAPPAAPPGMRREERDRRRRHAFDPRRLPERPRPHEVELRPDLVRQARQLRRNRGARTGRPPRRADRRRCRPACRSR